MLSVGQASILKCVSLCASTSTPTLAGSSRYSSIWVCLRNTLPRHALHNTRWKTGRRSRAITPVTNLREGGREGGREKILKEANFQVKLEVLGAHMSLVSEGEVCSSARSPVWCERDT